MKHKIVLTLLCLLYFSQAIYSIDKKVFLSVEKVATDLNTNTFTIYLKSNATITPKKLKEQVEKAGFFVGSMVITLQFENLKMEDNLFISQNNLPLIFIDSKPKILNGETRVKILDKGFVTQKEFKKLSKSYAKYSSYFEGVENNYHVKTI